MIAPSHAEVLRPSPELSPDTTRKRFPQFMQTSGLVGAVGAVVSAYLQSP